MKKLFIIIFLMAVISTGCTEENFSEQLNKGFGEAEIQFRSKDIIQAEASASSFKDPPLIKFRLWG